MNKPNLLKILLVQPPVEDFYFTPHRSSSLGLYTLAACWNTRGHSCRVLNCTTEKPVKKKVPLPEQLRYLDAYLLKQPEDMKGTSWFSQYYHVGPSIDICAEKIAEYTPDVVAVSCFAWSYSDSSRKLLEELQELRKMTSSSFMLVAGGPGVTVMPEYFTPYADLVVSGEGEGSIDFIEQMSGKMDYPGRGKIINLKYSGDLPFVYNIVSRRKNRFTVSTIISRGCPKMCSFCANHLVFGRALRKISFSDLKNGIDRLIDEIIKKSNSNNNSVLLQEQEKIKLHINFEDDNILFYKDYFLEILNYTKEECQKNEIDFSFTTENGMDYILLDNKVLDKFKNLNIAQLNLSMASMDNEQLREENRSGNLKKLESILEYSAKLNIPSVTYFICGLKGDTPESIVETIKYLHCLETSIGISLYYPVPGLRDWQNKYIFFDNPSALCRGSSAYPWNNSLSTKELVTAFRLARTSNFIKTFNPDKKRVEDLKIKLLKDSTMEKYMVKAFFQINFPTDLKTT